MCGFVGFANSTLNIDHNIKIVNEMMDTIKHRGPDSGDFYADNGVTLGFRRLSIIDLSAEGNQPMCNEDESCVLVFNGEIYNYQELRNELINKGHIFKSDSDSEVVVHAYEEYGVELLHKVRGMFAFSLWDKNSKTLFLARDFFPLFLVQKLNHF